MKTSAIKPFLLCASTFYCLLINAQSAKITGKISTSDGKTAAEVNITLKEKATTIASKTGGTYTISNLAAGNYTLVVSYAGLITQEKKVILADNETANVDFTLSENRSQLEEIIVTASRNPNEKMIAFGKLPIKLWTCHRLPLLLKEAF